MAKKKEAKKAAKPVRVGSDEVALTRTGGTIHKFLYTRGMTAGKLMTQAQVEMKKGEMIVRNGARIKKTTSLKPGDIIFITADDGNGMS